MNTRRIPAFATLVLSLVLGACASARSAPNPFQGGSANENSVRIYVYNLNFTQVTVYGVTTGARQRLGVVEGKGEKGFRMNLAFATQLRLELDILAGPTCFTDQLPADPGDDFEITIQNGGSNLYCRVPG